MIREIVLFLILLALVLSGIYMLQGPKTPGKTYSLPYPAEYTVGRVARPSQETHDRIIDTLRTNRWCLELSLYKTNNYSETEIENLDDHHILYLVDASKENIEKHETYEEALADLLGFPPPIKQDFLQTLVDFERSKAMVAVHSKKMLSQDSDAIKHASQCASVGKLTNQYIVQLRQ